MPSTSSTRPFVYFGVHDGLDLRAIPWRRGQGYDTDALTNLYTSSDAWARTVVKPGCRTRRHEVDASLDSASASTRSVHGQALQTVTASRPLPSGATAATRTRGSAHDLRPDEHASLLVRLFQRRCRRGSERLWLGTEADAVLQQLGPAFARREREVSTSSARTARSSLRPSISLSAKAESTPTMPLTCRRHMQSTASVEEIGACAMPPVTVAGEGDIPVAESRMG